MATKRVYLDHNATTPVDPRVRDAMVPVLAGTYGNPSSVHKEGRQARGLVEVARRQVAELLAAPPEAMVFTSGGTEADALGIIGLARIAEKQGRAMVLAVAGTEHPAVHGAVQLLATRGWRVAVLPVDSAGVINIDSLAALCAKGVGLVAVAIANHEVGTVQAVQQIVAVAHDHGALVHADAVQAVGKLPVNVVELELDSAALSAHKIYGPKGIGALYVRVGLDLAPLLVGGHQERERRPGTENVPGIVGMGVAAQLATAQPAYAHIGAMRARLESGLLAIPGVTINAVGANRIANTTNVRFEGALAETVVASLDLVGFAVSTGAACTSGTTQPSSVLMAMGRSPREASECVRVSLGRNTTNEHVDGLLAALPDIVARARTFE